MCGIHASIFACDAPKINEDLKKSLCSRGPDFLGSAERTVSTHDLPDISICCTSTVLALRGDHVAKQPFESSDTGSVLCWNGEAWKIDGQTVNGNDGEAIFARLTATQGADRETRQNHVLNVLRMVKGPFAFVYYDAPGKCLYYGRDRLGRRSLLIHEQYDAGGFTLASIAGASSPEWKEVTADGIYAVDFDSCRDPSFSKENISRLHWTPPGGAILVGTWLICNDQVGQSNRHLLFPGLQYR